MPALNHSAMLVLAVAMATSLGVAARSSHATVNDFSWSDGGQSLALHSQSDDTSAGNVVVTRAEPSPFHGLRAGDMIVAVDGRPLHQVEGLMRALHGRTSDVALRVRRGGAETTLVWSRADYRVFLPPPPPAPPAAPPPAHG